MENETILLTIKGKFKIIIPDSEIVTIIKAIEKNHHVGYFDLYCKDLNIHDNIGSYFDGCNYRKMNFEIEKIKILVDN